MLSEPSVAKIRPKRSVGQEGGGAGLNYFHLARLRLAKSMETKRSWISVTNPVSYGAGGLNLSQGSR